MNKKELILAGGGGADDSKPLDELLLKSIPEDKELLYIPIAWKDSWETGNFSDCWKWFSSVFSSFGFSNFQMWTDLSNKTYEGLNSFGAMYIGGGNTFYLMDSLRKSGFLDILKKFTKSGRVVYGGSAGAIILGKSIKTASFGKDADENVVNLKDFSALNLVKNYTIQCHYESNQDKELMKFVESNNLPIIAISERSGLYVKNNKIQVVGFEPAFVFENGKKRTFQPNSRIS